MVRLIPLILLIVISSLGLGVSIARHKQPRKNEDAWATLIGLLIEWGLIVWLIW